MIIAYSAAVLNGRVTVLIITPPLVDVLSGPVAQSESTCTSAHHIDALPASSTLPFWAPFRYLPAFLVPFQLLRVGFAICLHTSFAAICTYDLSELVQRRRQTSELLASFAPKTSSYLSKLSYSFSMAALLTVFESFNPGPRKSTCRC